MATIRMWHLHGDVQKAIDYIMGEDKSEPGLSYAAGVYPSIAGIKWKLQNKEYLKEEKNYNDIVGYHLQQSFEVGSVTPEEALELTKKWVEEYTKGEYDYVINVHTDKPNIHAHVILNPMNNVTEKKLRTYYKRDIPILKILSNKICKEHGLRVLEDPKGVGRSYYQWMLDNQGDSSKSIIKKAIDNLIPRVQTYEQLKMYLEKIGYKVEDDITNTNSQFEFTVNIKMLRLEETTDEAYFIKIPRIKEYMYIPKSDVTWLGEKTMKAKIDVNQLFTKYDSNGNHLNEIDGAEMRKYWEDKTKNRSGLRITVPGGQSFIRCGRIENEEGNIGDYSLENIISKIEENDRLVCDPEIENVIVTELDKKESLKVQIKFNELATIKTKWNNSKYYRASKKDKFISWKRNSIQKQLNQIHSQRVEIKDILQVEKLKEDREMLRNELKEIKNKLDSVEKTFENIEIERVAGTLEMSENQVQEYIEKNIKPLRGMRLQLIKEIRSLTNRVLVAENKQPQKLKKKDISKSKKQEKV